MVAFLVSAGGNNCGNGAGDAPYPATGSTPAPSAERALADKLDINIKLSLSKLKYTCAGCGINVWGRVDLAVDCANCGLRMLKVGWSCPPAWSRASASWQRTRENRPWPTAKLTSSIPQGRASSGFVDGASPPPN